MPPIITTPSGVRPIDRPQTPGIDGVHRRDDGDSAFRPQTNVALQTAVKDIGELLTQVGAAQKEGVEKIPQELRQVIDNIMRQAFSLNETVGNGIGSTLESQRFSMDQLAIFSRMLLQTGALADKGFSMELPDSLRTLFANLKTYIGEKLGGTFEPVLLAKASFELLNTETQDQMPPALASLIASMQPGAVSQLQPSADESGMGFLKQLVQYFMPRPADEETTQQQQQQQQTKQGPTNHQTIAKNAYQFMQLPLEPKKGPPPQMQRNQNPQQTQNPNQPQSSNSNQTQQTQQNSSQSQIFQQTPPQEQEPVPNQNQPQQSQQSQQNQNPQQTQNPNQPNQPQNAQQTQQNSQTRDPQQPQQNQPDQSQQPQQDQQPSARAKVSNMSQFFNQPPILQPKQQPQQNQPNQTQNPNQPQQTQNPNQPNQTQNPNQPNQTQNPNQPQQTQNPNQPQQTQNPNQPNQTQNPNQPNQTQNPNQPNQTQNPNQPQQTQNPNQPNQTQNPNQPQQTQNPNQPNQTQNPNQPNQTQNQFQPNQPQPFQQNQPQQFQPNRPQPFQQNQPQPFQQNQPQPFQQNQPQPFQQNQPQPFQQNQPQPFQQNQPQPFQQNQPQPFLQQQQPQPQQNFFPQSNFFRQQQQPQQTQEFVEQSLRQTMQAAKQKMLHQPMQNDLQTMDTMRDAAKMLLKNANLTPQDEQILQQFVNQKDSALNKGDARHLQNLLRLCQQNVPITVQQAAVQQNLPELPRLWAFMQLCDMANAKNMSSREYKKAGRDIADFVVTMKHAMEGGNSREPGVQNQRSLNFMTPLYLGPNNESYPAYIHVYDEKNRDQETGQMKKETWIRICVLTDAIGAVELICRVYDESQLDMRLFFSDEASANSFYNEYFNELQNSLKNSSNLNLNDFKIGTV